MIAECGSCGRDKTMKARGLCSWCHGLRTLDGTLDAYGYVRADRIADYAELRTRHYAVEVAARRLGVTGRTGWRYEDALIAAGQAPWRAKAPRRLKSVAPVSPEQATRNRSLLEDGMKRRAAA